MSAKTSPRKLLAIDWDSRTLRIVHAAFGKRGVKIDRLLSVAIPTDVDPLNPQQMGRHIRQALDQEGIASRHATVDVPRDQAILNMLTLPAVGPEEMPGMVRIQIAKELPYPVGDAVIDFTVAPRAAGGATQEVLVAAVRREVLHQYESTFEAAGLKLDRIGLRPFANKIAVCELLKHAMPDRVLFVDVGSSLTEISVLRDSFLAFSRAASVHIPSDAGQNVRFPRPTLTSGAPMSFTDRSDSPALVSGADEVVQSLLVEVTRSIEAYRARDSSASLDHAVIGGDHGVEDALAEAIQKRLGIGTEIYNPASSFGWEPDEGAAASAFAATLGLVLGHAGDDRLQFDFLHPKRDESTTQRRLKRAPLVAAVVVLFIAAGLLTVAQATQADRAALAAIQARIEELKGEERDNKKFLEIVEGADGLRDFDTGQHVWVDVLHNILSVMPSNKELVLEQIDLFQKEGRLVLKTRSKSRDTCTETMDRLHEFRRDGRDKPRFKAVMGQQSEKSKEKYPYSQDLRIDILDDEPSKGSPSKGARSEETN